ncbi:unnamed protein product [Paramecium pentaurelia]|uniref:Uncharacterized protein n=1 Tax=Paramecium pentaurelia TaxID=43138 RepID=A0A8S1X8S3_9CILI|nr:unnamed protein product [Paramecium pentaurelia]
MQNLIKESKRIYSQFLLHGPKYLDTFDYQPITTFTIEALKTKSLQDYINKNLTMYQEISMLPIQFEPDNSFAFAIFTLAPQVTMPLHDHPDMFVLSYVLHGEGIREGWNIKQVDQEKVNQFKKTTIQQDIRVEAEELPSLSLKTGDICYTTPNKCNLHSFINNSSTQPFVFLDIIVPHYDESINRTITYFQRNNKENQLKLIQQDEL